MSSYRGHFRDLAPSDQADIASWSEPDDACCDLCGERYRARYREQRLCSVACAAIERGLKQRRPKTLDQVLARGEPELNTGCLLWPGGTSYYGYGVISHDGKTCNVHRLVLGWSLGRPLKRTEFACHRCDTPACFNPTHLFVASQAENILDAVRKGRHRYGDVAPRCGLCQKYQSASSLTPDPETGCLACTGCLETLAQQEVQQ